MTRIIVLKKVSFEFSPKKSQILAWACAVIKVCSLFHSSAAKTAIIIALNLKFNKIQTENRIVCAVMLSWRLLFLTSWLLRGLFITLTVSIPHHKRSLKRVKVRGTLWVSYWNWRASKMLLAIMDMSEKISHLWLVPFEICYLLPTYLGFLKNR